MATSSQNGPLPKFHKQRGRLIIFILLALFGIALFSFGHAFHKISKLSKQVSHLQDLLRENPRDKYSYLHTENVLAELSRNQASTKREVERLSSLLSQYRNDLLLIPENLSKSGKQNYNGEITKTLQDMNTAIAKQTQEILNIKKEMESSEKIMQAIVTSQVADIKKNDDLWNAVHEIEGSFGALVDADRIKSMGENYNRKFEQLSQEISAQKMKIEELSNARGEQQYQETKDKDPKVEISSPGQKPNNAYEAKNKQGQPSVKENYRSYDKAQENKQGGFHQTVKEAFKKGKDSMFKNVDEATKKMMKKIEKRASGVSKNIEKVKKALFSLF